MQKNIEKTQANWLIPVEVKEAFTDFCKNNGLIAQDAVAGALVIWQYLPAQLREQAMLQAKGIPSVDKAFWDMFRAGLELAINQHSIQQQKRDKK